MAPQVLQDVGDCSTTACPASVAPPPFMLDNWPKMLKVWQWSRKNVELQKWKLQNTFERFHNIYLIQYPYSSRGRLVVFGGFYLLLNFEPSKERLINLGVIFLRWYCFSFLWCHSTSSEICQKSIFAWVYRVATKGSAVIILRASRTSKSRFEKCQPSC